VDGVDVHEQPREAFHKVDAMLEGARNNYWRLTVRENLRYFATIGGERPSSVNGRHERLLETFGLLEKADEPVRDLSCGMKQKVSIASLLARDVQVAFLDEPTLGLDVEGSLVLREELRRIVDERDLTLIVSSHDMDVIKDICDRVVILQDGQIVADDTVSNLTEAFKTNEYRFTSETIDDSTLRDIRTRFDVSNVDRLGGTTRIEVVLDSKEYYRFNQLLHEREVELDSVQTITPDLEEIFLDITCGDEA
jgi:ABC-2 type transport system ATP-binding protein